VTQEPENEAVEYEDEGSEELEPEPEVDDEELIAVAEREGYTQEDFDAVLDALSD